MATRNAPYRVLIIGSGPAGLAIAHALQKQGIRCTVFEQDAALGDRPRDWNFGIYWAQNPLTECLPQELADQIAGVQVDNCVPSVEDVLPIFNGKTGELLKAVPAPLHLRLHRKRFLRLLLAGLDVQYKKRLARIESDGVTATAFFDDGTSTSGNLIIGAEGSRSLVREFLVGKQAAELEPAPLVASSTLTKLSPEAISGLRNLHQRFTATFHPDGYFIWIGNHEAYDDIPVSEHLFMIILSWRAGVDYNTSTLQGASILPDLKRRANVFAEPFKTILQAVPEGTKCWHNRLSCWSPRKWDNRNSTVTIVGDAAHSMTFHRGQGLNNAIHDAASLASFFKEKGIPKAGQAAGQTAVDAYEEEMRARGAEAVEGNLQNSIVTHNWEQLLESPLFKAGLSQKVKKDMEEEIFAKDEKDVNGTQGAVAKEQ